MCRRCWIISRSRVTDIPVLICRGDLVLRNPTNAEAAACFGLNAGIDEGAVYDLIVVGAGPSGLAAAVYGASEGLNVLVLGEQRSGRAGRIELQNRKLPRLSHGNFRAGAGQSRVHPGGKVRGSRSDRPRGQRRSSASVRPTPSDLDGGGSVQTRSIIVAAGAQYRKLDLPKPRSV